MIGRLWRDRLPAYGKKGAYSLESRDYERVLNAMPGVGVYVIRASDHGLLYVNKRAQEVSHGATLGRSCHEAWTGACSCCPLLSIEGRQESAAVSYNEAYGGVVDLTAARILWEGEMPAFVVTVAPRLDNGGFTYRKIMHIDLERDTYDELKSDPDSWSPEAGPVTVQMERFAHSGAIHPEDADRFAAFIHLEHLRQAASGEQGLMTLLYRRLVNGGWRWNMMEVLPDAGPARKRFVMLCVKDIHDVFREGLEREGVNARNQELIRSLGQQNFNIYTVDMDNGSATPIQVDGRMWEDLTPPALPWTELMRIHIKDRLHEAYQAEFEQIFSLEGLRQAWAAGRQKSELLCQWSSGGEHYRYISITAHFGHTAQPRHFAVLAIQDVDDRMCRELANAKRDMQMAAILRSRFRMLTTVYLDSGQCERMDLNRSPGAEKIVTGDYTYYTQNAMEHGVHPEDKNAMWSVLSLEHLRDKAANISGDYEEEVCQYRLRGDPIRWVESRVIYTRRRNHVMVNILGQDITREKNREDSRARELEDRAHIISSLSSLFFSTYYIDLEQDTYRAVTQLNRVGNVLGEEISCDAAMRIYAQHFVHPDDREEYLRVMSVANLRQTLRWWSPYAAVEYRKLPDNPADGLEAATWVRATAVLAQTGPGDMPSTAVYIAQDIEDSRRKAAR